MSFLDNLENSLKSLESQDERGSNDRNQRDAERKAAMAAAPKVYIAWIGTTLKLEARERKLELKPTPTGILALFIEPGKDTREQRLDLTGNPEELVREWLA
jgi:hypothetical protein